MNKKVMAILLAMLMTAPAVLTACSESTDNAETTGTPAATTTTPSAVESEEAADETERLEPDIPADANFNGYEFIITCTSNTEYGEAQDDFYAEEITGEPINDARYNRNASVGDKLNIKITDLRGSGSVSEGQTLISNAVKAGTADYDLAMAGGYATSTLAMNNNLYDLNKVPYLNLAAPWWDQVANKDLQVLGQLFYTTGDISTADNDATYCIMFNKQLIDDYNLQNPYDLVYDDKWTMDNFISMAEQVYEDLNGNGIFVTGDKNFDTDDRFGALI